MATLKAVVLKGETHKNSKGETNIKILVVQHGKNAYLKTDFYVPPEFMGKDGRVIKKHPNHSFINNNVQALITKYERKILDLYEQAHLLSINQIKEILISDRSKPIEFFSYADRRLNYLREKGVKTWKVYSDSIAQFKKFINRELDFGEITVKLLEDFETHLTTKGNKDKKEKNCSQNTVSVYIRSIRTIFYDAVDEYNNETQAVIINNPFRKFKIKTEIPEKRNLSIEQIKAIRDYTPVNKFEEVARDMFMLHFYLIGINTIDLFGLPPLKGNRIEFHREKVVNKSHRFYSIKVEPEALSLIEKHKGERFLLKYSDDNKAYRESIGIKLKKGQRYFFKYNTHKDFQEMINSRMSDIAKALKIYRKITTYYARHSWATIASNDCNIPDDDIALCLGHKDFNNKVTAGYINKSLDRIDRINRMVLDAIK